MRTSPWGDDGRVLVIHGDADTVSLAARSLTSPDTLSQTRGAEVAFVGDRAQSLTAATDQSAPAALAPVVTRHGIRPEVIVSSIVLVLFLLMIGLVIWFRWVRPRRRA
jgi:hypothetical protein